MGGPTGFSAEARKSGDVAIRHNGQHAVTLRGPKAQRFLTDVVAKDPQHLMARVTGKLQTWQRASIEPATLLA